MEATTSSYCYWLLFLVLFTPDSSNSGVFAVEEIDLYEKAEYHLKALSRTLQDIKSSYHHNIRKRDITTLGRKDKIINSLSTLCSELSYFKKNDVTGTLPTATPNSTTLTPVDIFHSVEDLSKWTKPEIFLVSVEAERDGDMANFTFNVSHTSQAFVTRLESLDFYSTLIGEPGKYDQPVTSKVLLSVNASKCKSGHGFIPSRFHFGLKENTRYSTTTNINVCKFDRVWNGTNDDHSAIFHQRTDKRVFMQDLKLPRFRMVSEPSYEIRIQPGENPYVDIDLVVEDKCKSSVMVSLWDWENQQFIYHSVEILPQNYYELYRERDENILSVDYLGQITLNDTETRNGSSTTSGTSQDVLNRIRINVNTGSNKMSGKFTLTFFFIHGNGNEEPVVDSVNIEKTILLKLPYKLEALPRNQIDEIFGGPSTCNRKELERFDETCTLSCYADGTDIDSIFIIKTHPYQPPVRATSYVIHGQIAHAINDLGIPTPDKEGTYQCVVRLKDGQVKREDLNLTTTGFTEINSTLVKDLGNDTFQVTCEASGYPPLDMGMVVYNSKTFGTERLDTEFENQRRIETIGKFTRLTLLVTKDQLQFPKTRLRCYANGKRGGSENEVDLQELIENHNP